MNLLKYSLALSIMVLLVGTTFAQKSKATEAPVVIKTKRVNCTATFEPTPQLNITLGESKGEQRTKWLKILGEFETTKETSAESKRILKDDGVKEKDTKDAPRKIDSLDEVKVKYEFLCSKGLEKSKKEDILLEGEEDYINIRRDVNGSKTKRVAGYVHPAIIEKHFPDFAKNSNLSNYLLAITIYDANGNEIASGYDASADMKTKYKLGSPIDAKAARKALDAFAANGKKKMIKRRGTPFEYTNFDYYEYLKPLEN